MSKKEFIDEHLNLRLVFEEDNALFMSNNQNSIWFKPYPAKREHYFISIYNYKDKKVTRQQVVSALSLNVLIGDLFHS